MQALIRSHLLALCALVVACTAAITMYTDAQPVRDRILQDIKVEHRDNTHLVRIRFSCPVSYRSHFPRDRGAELRIQVVPLPLCRADRDARFAREAIDPASPLLPQLGQISYEGDMTGGPYVIIHFSEPMHFEVTPDADHRGISVRVWE